MCELRVRGTTLGRARAQQSSRRAAENRLLIGSRNRKAAHLRHAVRRSHVEGIIAAQHDAGGTGAANEEFERLARVYDRVEVEALQRIRWRNGKVALGFGTHVPAVQEASGLIGD